MKRWSGGWRSSSSHCIAFAEGASSLASRARGAIDARHRHSRRYHYRWYRQRSIYRRRGNRGRAYRRRWRQAGSCSARDRRHRAVGDARLGRRAHALRRAGDVGSAARAFVLARRHHHDVRQLRRRLRSRSPAASRGADGVDGRRRGDPGRRARRWIDLGVGELPRFSRCAGAPAARDRYRGPDRASPAARLRHGRPRHSARGRFRRGHRGDAPSDDRGIARGRLRLHHLAHGFAQDAGGRDDAVAICRERSAVGHRLRAGRRRRRCLRHEQRFRRRKRRARLDDAARQGDGPPGVVLADRPLRGSGALAAALGCGACGAHLTAQIAGRPIGVMLGIGTALNPFSVRPSYRQLDGLSIAEQRQRLREPALRRKILDEQPSAEEVSRLAQFRQLITTRWDKFFVMGDPPDYEPSDELSCAAIAAREGRTPAEVAYDYLTEAENRYLYFPVVNYVYGDHEPIREMLTDSATLLGLSDGGAHCASIVDAGVPTYMLLHWGRDRRRGPRLPLELLVKRQTSETADFFGLRDRGRLTPGLRADVNLIDFGGLRLYQPELVNDLPAGGRRFVQRVDGYVATLLAGTPTFERGEHTGAMPGRLVRAGHA